jgi:hypothetical protein
MWRLLAANGDPRFAELTRAWEYTQRMRERGELRPTGRVRFISPIHSLRITRAADWSNILAFLVVAGMVCS